MSEKCFHCDLDIPKNINFELSIFNQNQRFCCMGCFSVAEMICENGLQDFYSYRTDKSKTFPTILPQEFSEFEELDSPEVLKSIVRDDDSSDAQWVELGIEGITCAACGWLIKKKVNQLNSVKEIQVNITSRRAQIKLEKGAELSPILKEIRKLGYHAFPFKEEELERTLLQENKDYIKRLIVSGIAMMQVMMFAIGFYIGEYQDISQSHGQFLHWISGVVATPVVFYAAYPFIKSAWYGIKHFHFGMNFPVSIAILSGYFASLWSLVSNHNVYYFDSVVMFTFFLLLGRFVEHRVRLKSLLKQQSFNRLLPLSATRKNDDASVSIIPVNEIKKNDLIIVHAGCVVPVDGLLIDKHAELNESIITGEFLPVTKNKGDMIYSGATNHTASITIKTTTDPQNSRIQHLVKLENQSESISAQQNSSADKVANWFVITLLLLCFLTAFYWWQVDPERIFPIVLSLLVVSCPCALSLAMPTAIAACITQLTEKGLMVRNKESLLKLAKVTDVFFDKTGTLTTGKMSLVSSACYDDSGMERTHQIAASLESISSHPIAEVFKKFDSRLLDVSEHQEVIAQGVSGKIGDSKYHIGKYGFAIDNSQYENIKKVKSQPSDVLEVQVYLSNEEKIIGIFSLADELNEAAVKAVSLLAEQTINVHVLSGDSKEACDCVAESIGVSSVFFAMSPEQKLNTIASLKNNHRVSMMVGDGVNDIGAFNEADVSITMGSASLLSQTHSDAVLVSRDLKVIPDSILLSKKLSRIIKQNLGWAIMYNISAIPFAAAGFVPAWLAAIGMASSSLVVVFNALRLRY